MAPEIRGNSVMGHSKYNKLADVWSIGVIAFFLVMGEYPYTDMGKMKSL